MRKTTKKQTPREAGSVSPSVPQVRSGPLRPETAAPAPPPWRRWALSAGLIGCSLLALAWGGLCLRSGQHYRAGVAAESAGRLPEAVREYESAVGFYAPFNPFCRAAAVRMLGLAADASEADPPFAAEARERLRRALRSLRGSFQPHADLLTAAGSKSSSPEPRDPRGALFLLSWMALLAGLAGGGLARPLRFRLVSIAVGLGVWALLIYLC